jgi:prepilin-type N-terminal cleavage/methylation domain-containing protein
LPEREQRFGRPNCRFWRKTIRGLVDKGLAMSRARTRGFSLVELMISMAVFLIAAMIITMGVQPALKEGRVNQAYNTTLAAMRLARDTSIAQRQSYYVTLSNATAPNSISITQASTGAVIDIYYLPTDVTYQTLPIFPTSQTTFPMTPNGFGVGVNAIDFDQGIAGGTPNVIYFMPDGSAQDIAGNYNNGVVYVARTGDNYSPRALTLFGATGRLRGWRMDTLGVTYYWRYE